MNTRPASLAGGMSTVISPSRTSLSRTMFNALMFDAFS
jgi:hypothetical protein